MKLQAMLIPTDGAAGIPVFPVPISDDVETALGVIWSGGIGAGHTPEVIMPSVGAFLAKLIDDGFAAEAQAKDPASTSVSETGAAVATVAQAGGAQSPAKPDASAAVETLIKTAGDVETVVTDGEKAIAIAQEMYSTVKGFFEAVASHQSTAADSAAALIKTWVDKAEKLGAMIG